MAGTYMYIQRRNIQQADILFFLFFCFGGFSADHFSLYCVRKPNQKQKIQQSVGSEMALLQTNM